ncbi:MAG: cytochrome P450 [Cyanobacteria bacterium RI_101]|nr:cytochrome P450 [Cyanobacteria bacterium RI_101]
MASSPPLVPLSAPQQAKNWITKPLEFLDRSFREYGDVFTLNLGALGETVFFCHPDAVAAIFKLHGDLFECHQFNVSYRDLMGDNALFLQNGEAHRRLRRIMTPPFHRERVQKYSDSILRLTQEAIGDWRRGKVINVRRFCHELALAILMEIVFGDNPAPGKQIQDWFRAEVFKETEGWKPWFGYGKLQPQIRDLITQEIRRRLDSGDLGQTDLLNWLHLSTDEKGQPLTPTELQDQLLTLMITAVDPIAMSLAWALFWIQKLPEVQRRVQTEIDGLGGALNPEKINALPYLGAVCQETLRLHPILPTVSGRRLTEEREILGYTLPAGTTVAACAYLVHRRPELYPDPLAFKPERFLERDYSPYEYFPFGGGNRQCLGAALAPLELKLILATVLSQHRLSLVEPTLPETVRYGTLVAPAANFRLLVLQ